MPSRRYFIATSPVAHINGKMAPLYIKCPNTDNPEAVEVAGFWYGFKRQARPSISRYAIRKHCRFLQTKPYTPSELTNRQTFTASLEAVHLHHEIADDWALMLQDFSKQTKYPTPIGYAVAMVRDNQGIWLPCWSTPD